ncbi:MAG: 4a-hydroxytetrahydrobiopterin dehydratase [Deltaproteobacteria bacterium]|nr:4a-hydroxytetrahydrobiopterin dehydratase [Deltaproteobacteria bacterium]
MPRSALDDVAIAARLEETPGWAHEPGCLRREFRFDDFAAAFRWMTRVAAEADAMGHHPDWRNVYDTVDVRLSTHDIDGISEDDFALARRMNALFATAGADGPAAAS